MITIEKAKTLSQAIINHACNYLSIDETSIRMYLRQRWSLYMGYHRIQRY